MRAWIYIQGILVGNCRLVDFDPETTYLIEGTEYKYYKSDLFDSGQPETLDSKVHLNIYKDGPKFQCDAICRSIIDDKIKFELQGDIKPLT